MTRSTQIAAPSPTASLKPRTAPPRSRDPAPSSASTPLSTSCLLRERRRRKLAAASRGARSSLEEDRTGSSVERGCFLLSAITHLKACNCRQRGRSLCSWPSLHPSYLRVPDCPVASPSPHWSSWPVVSRCSPGSESRCRSCPGSARITELPPKSARQCHPQPSSPLHLHLRPRPRRRLRYRLLRRRWGSPRSPRLRHLPRFLGRRFFRERVAAPAAALRTALRRARSLRSRPLRPTATRRPRSSHARAVSHPRASRTPRSSRRSHRDRRGTPWS